LSDLAATPGRGPLTRPDSGSVRTARQTVTSRRVDHEGTRRRQRPDPVSHVRRNDGDFSRSEDALLPINPDRNLTIEDAPAFLLWMMVLVDIRGAGGDLVAGGGHSLAVQRTPRPAWHRLDVDHVRLTKERHSRSLQRHRGCGRSALIRRF